MQVISGSGFFTEISEESKTSSPKNLGSLALGLVKSIVVEVGQRPDKEFIPLVRYLGGTSIPRVKALLSFVLSMKEANVCTTAEICKISKQSPDLIHLEGLHAPVVNTSLNGICSRLNDNPKFLELYPGLHEYIHSIPRLFLYSPTRISRFSTRTRWDWRKAAPKPFVVRQKQEPLFYPFAAAKSSEVQDCELLMAVHEVVPKGLPNQLRGDICQELIIKILSGDLTYANLQDDPSRYVSALMKQHPGRYGEISLDSTDEDGRTMMQHLGL